MFENERNDINKTQAIEALPDWDEFRVVMVTDGNSQHPAGTMPRKTVVEYIDSSNRIQSVGGGYPYFPFIDALEISITDGEKVFIDFGKRIDVMQI